VLFRSNYANDKKLANKLSLAYSSRTFENAVFFDEIRELENANKNFSALFSITDEKIPAGAKNIINEKLDKDIIKGFVGNCQNKHFFICGPMPFMNAVKESLLSVGAGEKQIEMEEFSMIPDAGAWAKVKNFSYALGLSTALMFAPFYVIYSADKISAEPAIAKNQIFKLASARQEPESANNPPEQQENSTPVKTPAQAISQAPKATTSASITAESELAIAGYSNNNTASQNQQIAAPQPATSASAPAQTQTAQQTAQTTQATQNPAPTTSASTPAQATQTAQTTQTTQNQTAVQTATPAPATSASTTPAPSAPAPAAQSAPTSQQTPASQPAPATSASATPASTTPASSQQTSPSQTTASTTQPAPTTSASGTVVLTTPSSTPSQITPPQTSSQTRTTRERDDHDEDDDD